jgi:hypothetical protein
VAEYDCPAHDANDAASLRTCGELLDRARSVAFQAQADPLLAAGSGAVIDARHLLEGRQGGRTDTTVDDPIQPIGATRHVERATVVIQAAGQRRCLAMVTPQKEERDGGELSNSPVHLAGERTEGRRHSPWACTSGS